MSDSFDVVIVGGGPAGSTCATHLAERGISVAVIEKRQLEGDSYDRDKPCGGGLDGSVWRWLPASVDVSEAKEAIVEHWSHTVVARYDGRYEAVHERDQPIIGLGMRHRIDGYFMRKAIDAGAEIVQGSALGIGRTPGDGYRVQLTDGQAVVGKYLVGADGSYSVVARALGLRPRMQTFVASEWETDVAQATWEPWEGRTLIDVGSWPTIGYSWIWPKRRGHLSIGWGIPKRMAPKLKGLTRDVFSTNGIEGVTRESSHHINFNIDGGLLAQQRGVFLLGDAAGLCCPANGAGIWPAMASASWAAKTIIGELAHLPALSYTHKVHELLASFKIGRALRNYMWLQMLVNPRKATSNPQIWGWWISDVQGDFSYEDWAKDHPWKYRLGRALNPLVDRVAVRS